MAHTRSQPVAKDGDIQNQFSTASDQDVEAFFGPGSAGYDVSFLEKYRDRKLDGLTPFQKLQKLHTIPPPFIPYNAATPLTCLLRYSASGLEMTLMRPDFWCLFLAHVALAGLYEMNSYGIAADGTPLAPGWPKVGLTLVSLQGALVTLTLVFYLNQAFSRYMGQNGYLFGAVGAMSELLLLLRMHLHDHAFSGAQVVRHQLCRLANAVLVVALTVHPQFRDDRIDEWGWFYLLEDKFMTPAQVEELKPLAYYGDGRLAFLEAIMWVTRGVWAQQSKGQISSKVATHFTYKLMDIRKNLEELYDVLGPMPFAYYHLLNFIVLTYLVLLAYAFVFISPLWSIPAFFLILAGLLGVREVANALCFPIGQDCVDIPVFHTMDLFIRQSFRQVNAPPGYHGELEDLKPSQAAGEDPFGGNSESHGEGDGEAFMLGCES